MQVEPRKTAAQRCLKNFTRPTDSGDIDEDSDRPAKKRDGASDFSKPELRELIGASTSDSDQSARSDEDLPNLRRTTAIKAKGKGTVGEIAIKGVSDKAAKITSKPGRSWTATKEHRNVPVPAKTERSEQKFFSDA